MGVDFLVCDHCGCTFPDCGPWYTCINDHTLCEVCGDDAEADDGKDENGYVRAEVCPICKAGGTKLDQIKTLCENALLDVSDIDILHSAVQKILKLVTGEK